MLSSPWPCERVSLMGVKPAGQQQIDKEHAQVYLREQLGVGGITIMATLPKHARFSSTHHANKVCVRPEACFILCSYAPVKLDIMCSPNPSQGRQHIPKQERRAGISKEVQAQQEIWAHGGKVLQRHSGFLWCPRDVCIVFRNHSLSLRTRTCGRQTSLWSLWAPCKSRIVFFLCPALLFLYSQLKMV